jgi:hypothetical protein
MGKYPIIILLLALVVDCSNYGQLSLMAKLPKSLDENSGMAYVKDSAVWFIEDSGNRNKLYRVNFEGKITKDLEVKDAKNIDWEDLAKDDKNNLFIGDFGNNNGKRVNMVIYKVSDPEIEPGDKIDSEKIIFQYPADIPGLVPNESTRFDTEAMFYLKEHLYLITKNQTEPFNPTTRIFKVPAQKGRYIAEFIGEFKTCGKEKSCRVTGATISPDAKKVVLLGNGKLWVFTDFLGDDFSKGSLKSINLKVNTQLEALSFLNDSILLLSDEERAGTGRNLYRYRLR